jgi:hypothetical protein
VDYIKHYFFLTNKARTKNTSGYLELHHIIPRCVFDEEIFDKTGISHVNAKENVVLLTAREHFVAHWLLHRAFPSNKKLGLAFWAMAGMISPEHQRLYIPSSRAVEEARIAATNSRKVEILCYDLTGNFIREYASLNEASEEVMIPANGIGQAINGSAKSAGGFQWLIKTSSYSNKIDPYIAENNGLPIAQYSLNGTLIASFNSLLDAERKLGYSEGSIRAAMNRGSKIKGLNSFFVQYEKYQRIEPKVNPFSAPIHGFAKGVVQLSPDGKHLIKKFNSIKDAASSLGKATGHISATCLGKRETAYGYKWVFESEFGSDLPTIDISAVKTKDHSKKVAQFDLEGNFIQIFKSTAEASRNTGIEQSNISTVARGLRSYAGKFQWAYLDNNDIPDRGKVKINDNIPKRVLQLDKITKSVIRIYASVGEAAIIVNGNQSNISACINGRKKTAYGYLWEIENI